MAAIGEPIEGDKMFTIPAKKSEASRDEPRGRDDVGVPPANHNSDDQEVNCSSLRGRT
jgi:hypothetical protein